MSSPRLTALSLGLATTALLVAAYSAFSARSARSPAPQTASPDDSAELEAVRAQLAAVERRLATAERNLLLATRTNDDEPPGVDSLDENRESDDDERLLADGSERQTTPKFVEFEIAEAGLDVRQNENGSLSVRNSNPALANQVVTIKAQGEDGQIHELPITVPPAE